MELAVAGLPREGVASAGVLDVAQVGEVCAAGYVAHAAGADC